MHLEKLETTTEFCLCHFILKKKVAFFKANEELWKLRIFHHHSNKTQQSSKQNKTKIL
jgi:hypothetical protein